jgi:hypothetical protein
MVKNTDSEQAERVVHELRASADKLIARSRELAEEAERLKQRADDLAELIRRHNARNPHADAAERNTQEKAE